MLGLGAADVDGDGAIELVVGTSVEYAPGGVPSGYWFVAATDPGLPQEWTSLSYATELRGVTSVAVPESRLVVLTASELQLLDGGTREILSAYPLPTTGTLDFAIADLSPGASLELVLCDEQDLFVLDFVTGALRNQAPGLGCRDLETGQLDGDPALEIALAGNAGGVRVLDGVTLAIEASDTDAQGQRIAVADLNLDGFLDLVYNLSPIQGIRARDSSTWSILWEDAAAYSLDVAAGNLRGDGRAEVVAADWNGEIRVLEGESGALLGVVAGWTGGAKALALVNIDADTGLEIVASAESHQSSESDLIVADGAALEIELADVRLRGPFPGLSPADLDGDGRPELATASGGRLLSFDLVERRLDYVGPSGSSAGAIASALAQLDGDPSLEQCTLGPYRLRCEDTSSRLLEWEIAFPYLATSLLAADLDGDGSNEVLVGTGFPAVYVFEGNSGWLRFRTAILPGFASEFQVLRTGNVDSDPDQEIVAGGVGVAVFDGLTGALESGPYGLGISALEIGEIDGTAPAEILVGTISGSVARLDASTGALSPIIPAIGDRIESLRLADATRDGLPDFIYSDGNHVRVWGGAETTEIWRSPYLNVRAGMSDGLYVEDVDANSVLDILVDFGLGFAIFESPLFDLFADGFESGDTSAWSAAVP
jgi:hypothetical protein